MNMMKVISFSFDRNNILFHIDEIGLEIHSFP